VTPGYARLRLAARARALALAVLPLVLLLATACGGMGRPDPSNELDCKAGAAFYALSGTPKLPRVSQGPMRMSWMAEPSAKPSGRDGGAAVVTGFAAPGSALFDVVVLVDVSLSTRAPSGADLNDNKGEAPALADYIRESTAGRTRQRRVDPGDSILIAELRAAEELLARLDPARSRVGVVAFSGASGRNKPDAVLFQSPTNDYSRVRRAFDEIAQDDPIGYSHTAAGVTTALRTLTQRGVKGPPARRVVLMLTDGEPTLPFGQPVVTDAADIDAALRAGCSARAEDTGIFVLGFGEELAERAPTSEALARVTGGRYQRVEKPNQIPGLIAGTSFTGVQSVTAENMTYAKIEPVTIGVGPDGSFRGEIDLRAGPNRIRVTAVGPDGDKITSEKVVEFIPATLSTGNSSPYSSTAR